MKKLYYLLSLFLIIAYSKAHAQGSDFGVNYYYNSKGEVIKSGAATDVDGDPYLYNTWFPGSVKVSSGKIFNALKLRYDISQDMLTFKYDSGDEPLKFADDIVVFNILSGKNLTFAKGYPAIDSQTPESFYQVLSTGQLTLLKHYRKSVIERKNYDATVTKFYQQTDKYYAVRDKKIVSLDKSKKGILELMADKSDKIKSYLSSHNLNFKKDEDLANLFDYYNSI